MNNRFCSVGVVVCMSPLLHSLESRITESFHNLFAGTSLSFIQGEFFAQIIWRATKLIRSCLWGCPDSYMGNHWIELQ